MSSSLLKDEAKRKREIEKPNDSKLSEVLKKPNRMDDYLHVVENIVYPCRPSVSYGYDFENNCLPIHNISSLGFLKSPLREVSPLEKWNPFEIAVFESSIFLFGKKFNLIQKETVKEVIEFYYFWKKSNHYKVWKNNFISDDRETPSTATTDEE